MPNRTSTILKKHPSLVNAANKATPFLIKRKQINLNPLDTPNTQPSVEAVLLKEKDDTIKELTAQLNQTKQELQSTRHHTRLMENERQEFEASIIKKCSKQKEQVELELKLLKEAHVEKIQSLSTSINQLSNKVTALRNQLKEHQLVEKEDDDPGLTEEETLLSLLMAKSEYQQEAQFIQDAYKAIHCNQSQYPLIWSNIQTTVRSIQHEINGFHAWKSIPIAELTKLLKDDRKHHNSTVKSLLFSRMKRS
ncbi:MAG: hypothetical protein EXX96DRAFT_556578 [Benjaminiella poitrasii]|nr:MAG: hypothetical protein EXX96DRAFT_556578 [Benjaminiella poitrasii]